MNPQYAVCASCAIHRVIAHSDAERRIRAGSRRGGRPGDAHGGCGHPGLACGAYLPAQVRVRYTELAGPTFGRAETRAFFGPRLGRGFSNVRVHADRKSAESTRAANACAYTLGQDVVFGAGQYVPQSEEGKRLLVHELTHVGQQNGMAGGGTFAQQAM